MLSDRALELLKSQIQELNEYFRFTWTVYLSWYTFFVGLNLVALTFFHQIEKSPNRLFVAFAFLVFNLLGVITALWLYAYTKAAVERQDKTRRHLWNEAASPEEIQNLDQFFASTPPAGIAKWAVVGNSVTLVLFIVIWAFLLF